MKSRAFIGNLLILLTILIIQPMVLGIGIIPLDQQRPVADLNGNRVFDDLEMEMNSNQGPYPVILHLTGPANSGMLEYLRTGIGEFSPTYIYRHLNALAAVLTQDQISKLQDDPKVQKIQWDVPIEIYMDTATLDYGVSAGWRYGLTGDRDSDPGIFTPQDVVIAIIDTGIDINHVDLPSNKLLGWLDLLNGQTIPYDDHGHGTHVSGIAAGLGIGDSVYTGVAPGAGLVMVKALDGSGKSRMSVVDAGIEWIIDHREQYGIDVLSISFGSKGSANGSDSTCRLVNLAVDQGINVVVAAGNLGSTGQNIGSPGAAEKAITVGAMSDAGEGGEFLAYFSSRGPTLDGRPKPDLVGPGWRIMAPLARTTDQYIVFSGTSMTAPFTAGAIGQLLDLVPTLTPEQVKDILLTTAEDWGPGGWDIDYGWGRLFLDSALNFLLTGDGLEAKKNHFQVGEDLPGQGYYDRWIIDLYSTDLSFAITMVSYLTGQEDNLNLYLYDPGGNLVARGEKGGRHEWISYQPITTGTYILEVVSYQGSGSYYLDLHGDILNAYLVEDNRL